MTNLEWIQKGKTGCTFATLFSKNPASIGWVFYFYKDWKKLKKIDALIVSIEFPPDMTKERVRNWALKYGFYEESTSDSTVGLRYHFAFSYDRLVEHLYHSKSEIVQFIVPKGSIYYKDNSDLRVSNQIKLK